MVVSASVMELDGNVKIETVEMHTGGEPLRIIKDGYPPIEGKTILEKRRYVMENFDAFRQMLMFEPRGHFDMYGAILVPPDHPDADIGVLFIHNEGYSSMCGHGVIALGRYVVDNNLSWKRDDIRKRMTDNVIQVGIQCPCGLVRASVKMDGHRSREVSFVSVPAFCLASDVKVKVEGYGEMLIDIGYGGAFYALVPDKTLNLELGRSSYQAIVDAAAAVTHATKEQVVIQHPEEADLSFLYGTIVTDGKDVFDPHQRTNNVCVFADREVDRCPTGSGVTARIAVQYAKKQISLGQCRKFGNALTNSEFIGKPVEETKCGAYDAVRVEVSGHAYYTGSCIFTLEEDDPLRHGFLVH